MEFIPLLSGQGHILDQIDLEYALANPGAFVVKFGRSRNGKPPRAQSARRRERMSLVPLSRNGECKEQALSTGHIVYALRGTPGSQSVRLAYA